jgi:NADH-quinone oxidoreductase subunit F
MVEFFRHESCGKCTPYREGTMWFEKILFRITDSEDRAHDIYTIKFLSKKISRNVLFALGDFSTSPVVWSIKHYPGDDQQHVVKIGVFGKKSDKAAE